MLFWDDINNTIVKEYNLSVTSKLRQQTKIASIQQLMINIFPDGPVP